ncbi:hypothetical protein FQN54_006242 [Arachnomyces sp. PD_36]|nr:hypothetical protein FQN54_006242 [Arachnomyces sp. PD_36]
MSANPPNSSRARQYHEEDALLPSSGDHKQAETWKNPRVNIWRFFATNFAFVILGANDAVYGALIPYLEEYYNQTYTTISLIFLSPIVGYVTSALLNNMIHMHLGQRGIAILGPGAHLIAYVIVCLHPPYPVLVVVFMIAGFGNGVADAAWNAWLGAMENSNELLGFLHGFYGLGAMLAPLIATTLITKAGWEWYMFYYIMVGGAVLEVIFLVSAFWTATGDKYREAHPPTTEESLLEQRRIESNSVFTKLLGKSRTAEAMSNKVTWLCSLFLIAYVGVEVAIGGWVVTFMIKIRHGTPFASGMVATGFWTGITVGRVILGFVTPRLFPTEKHATAVYLIAAVILQLLFWLIPNFIVSAVVVSFLGFFLGPLFPATIIAATKLLPKQLHVSAIGFAAALGAAGATILPFAVGAIAEVKGVWVLNPIALAMIAACLTIWLCFPSMRNKHPAA